MPHQKDQTGKPPIVRRDDDDATRILSVRVKRIEDAIPKIRKLVEDGARANRDLAAKVVAMQSAAVNGVVGITARVDDLKVTLDTKILPGLALLLSTHEDNRSRWDKVNQRVRAALIWLAKSAGQAVIVIIGIAIYQKDMDLGKFAWPILMWFAGKLGL